MINPVQKFLKAKRRKGLKFYAHGVMITLPNIETGEVTKLTFRGSFDRRKLRKMLRATLVSNMTTVEIDYIIDNFATKLRPVTKSEYHAALTALEDADAAD